ncbi:hypothetical protein AOC36_05865 [Erysipelothrix larvae]|uniref:DUF5067 domain-containing protein n=1 Tax=Erysipelothrix larvae TaxID=1514105 RepID=A0A109UH11_9FIRM|nr:hypothetical protein [Erysipelothrix larvae]AMC93523.1 hypothetical protein AOC36_05865 [Erysipelothrix larvae]
MRKLKILCLLVCVLALTACDNSKSAAYQEQLNLYETYYRALLNEDRFQTSSRFYSITTEIAPSDEGYQYVVTIDDAKIAMYDVQIMVVENEEPFNLDVMKPSAGIFDGDYIFIPNQAREDHGFKKGIVVGRLDLQEDNVTIRVLVAWKNYTKLESFKEVFEFELKYEKPVEEPEEDPGDNPVDDTAQNETP